MKRYLLMFFLGAIAAGALAFATAYHVVCRHHAASPVGILQDVSALSRELDLSGAQIQQLQALNAEWIPVLQGSCSRSCRTRRAVTEALADAETDAAKLDTLIMELCCAYEESERATLAHLMAVRALLSETQQQVFDSMLSRCLCASCGDRSRVALASPSNPKTEEE